MAISRKHKLASMIRKKQKVLQNKKTLLPIETKTSTKRSVNLLGSFSFSECFRGWQSVRVITAWRYYKSIAPIGDAVNKTSSGFKTISPAIFDKEEKIFIHAEDSKIPASKVLSLMDKPNREDTGSKFLDKISKSFQVTGEVFLVITAISEGSEPMELFYINPRDVEPQVDGNNIVRRYTITNNGMASDYHRFETDSDHVIYISDDGKRELCHIKQFNPDESNGDARGMSELNPLFFEIEQYELSQIHNGSMLKNGARPSAILFVDPGADLAPDQLDRAEQQLKEKFQGPQNAGNVMICEGGKDLKQISQNNKDMEFKALIDGIRDQIYRNLGIPQPLVNASAMTMNNFSEAKFMLFDMRIIPIAKTIYDELDKCLMRRYETQDGRYSLFFDKSQIPAIKVRENQEIDRVLKSNAVEVNEARQLLGFVEKEIYNNQLLNNNINESSANIEGGEKDNSQKRFVDILLKKGFSMDKIEDKVKKLYG